MRTAQLVLSTPHQLAFLTNFDNVFSLQLAFAKKSLRDLCENKVKADCDLGMEMAEKLRRRLADFRAATCVTDLVAGQPRELKGGRRAEFTVELNRGSRVILCANHNTVPLFESGGVDWSKVTRVKILRIENNYGG